MAGLSLVNINKTYKSGYSAVKDFSLEIQDEEFIILVGPSGCGKSTKMGKAKLLAGFPGIWIFSTAYILPMAIVSSSAAMIFKIMLHPSIGIVNKLLGLSINWINDPDYALVCVALLTAWLNSGINFLYFSAGLRNIDETIYERASVDGAGESTNLIVYSIYRDTFFNYRVGSAAAQSVLLFMFRLEKKGVNY